MLFFLTLFPHLILKSGGQNNGGTKRELEQRNGEKKKKYLLAFFYFTAKLDWADLGLTDRKSVEKKNK